MLILAAIGFGIGIALVVRFMNDAFKALQERRLIENTPTVKAKGVFIGTVELRGTAALSANDSPLIASISGTPCVYLRNELEKSNGAEWKLVHFSAKRLRFWELRDETGFIRVVSKDAELQPRLLGERYLSPVQRVREYGVPLGSKLYVFGKAQISDDATVPEIVADATRRLWVSVEDETRVLKKKKDEARFFDGRACWTGGVLGASFVCSTATIYENAFGYAALIGAFLGMFFYSSVYVVCLGVSVANSLIDLNAKLRQAKSNADVELTRRADLFLAQVSAAQASVGSERAVEALATLRLQAEIERPTVSFDGGARPWAPTLAALTETTPELTTNQAFAYLQKSVGDAEERIALARGYYNAVAKLYETRRLSLPTAIIAFLLRLREARFFKTEFGNPLR